jgi:TRAP-type mannitol/chloroaromatic compound transport system permease small subunit
MLGLLVKAVQPIDWLSRKIGETVRWIILIAVLICAGNASVRYLFSTSSNAWLEAQWYLFSAVFLLCAGYTLMRNEHVRIDVISSKFSHRTLAWVDIIGTIFFLLPMALLIVYFSWPMWVQSYQLQEVSTSAGGLIRWPVKILIPIGFALLVMQAIAELLKRIAFLAGAYPDLYAETVVHGTDLALVKAAPHGEGTRP